MKNTFGNVLTVTIFGESHGPAVGAVLDGLTPGIPVSEDFINKQLRLRRPQGEISTARQEPDEFQIVSGVFEGKTTGTPLVILIPNQDTRSRDYRETRFLARPGHADYTAYEKYHGFEDYRGGGHHSGRVTAALVAAGGILLPALFEKGIRIGTHMKALGTIYDRAFSEDPETLAGEIDIVNDKSFAVLSEDAASKMQEEILKAKEASDSVGGVLETAVTGLPAGLGEPWFDSMESMLSHALFSIPGIKGVEFGDALSYACGRGSAYNDAFYIDSDTGKVRTETNHNGGVNGGLTNGMPVIFRTAVKPTPSIFQKQRTIDFHKMENAEILLSGRHDPAIIHRARVVQDSVTAMVLADFLCLRYGTDALGSRKWLG